jgi:hypothetical protein
MWQCTTRTPNTTAHSTSTTCSTCTCNTCARRPNPAAAAATAAAGHRAAPACCCSCYSEARCIDGLPAKHWLQRTIHLYTALKLQETFAGRVCRKAKSSLIDANIAAGTVSAQDSDRVSIQDHATSRHLVDIYCMQSCHVGPVPCWCWYCDHCWQLV